MKIKKILTAGVLASSFVLLASCNNNESTNSKPSEPSSLVPSDTSSSSANGSSSVSTDYYKVQVLYEDNTPAKDIIVQWCNVSGDCYAKMETTDENGYVTTTDKNITSYENDLTVHIMKASLPEGYSFDPNELVQNKENREGVIHLIKLNSADALSLGETGTDSNPYEVTVGAYNVEAGKESNTNLWISFTPSEAGTYVFESHAESSLDPLLSVRKNDEGGISKNTTVDGDGKLNNFKYELTVSEDMVNKKISYKFVIQQKTNLDEAFLFTITKK